MVACINLNLCAGIGTGIKGAVHATLEEYGMARSQPTDAEKGYANRTPLLTNPLTPNMPALSQFYDTGDYQPREGTV